jgi:outer membrane receptor protein involved in Fe transport
MSMKKPVRCVMAGLLISWITLPPVHADDNREAVPRPSASGEKSEELPDVVITGDDTEAVPANKDYTILPPRDLILRPVIESPGLESSTSVVGRAEIDRQNPDSLVDAMKYIPGAWTETRGRKVKKFFSFRGQRYPYPGYAIDGAWFREMHETNYFFNAALVDRIEIVRSSSALLLGPGGMTGMINIIPRTFDGPETQIETIFGEHHMTRTNIIHGNRDGKVSYAGGVSYSGTRGPAGMNAAEDIANYYMRLSYRPTDEITADLMVLGLVGDRQLKLAKAPASGTLQTRKDRFDPMRSTIVIGKLRFEPDDRSSTEITGNMAYRHFAGQRVGSADWVERDYELGGRILHSRKLCDYNTLRIGGMINHWRSPTGKRFYVGRPGDLTTYSAVIVDEHDFGRLDVNAGMRWSRTRIKEFGGFSVEGSSKGLTSVMVENEWEDPLPTLSLGASYDLTDTWKLMGNVTWGRLSSSPGMLDLNLSQPGPETRQKYDIGLKKLWKGYGEASITGFFVRQKDAPILSNTSVLVAGESFGLYESGDRDNFGVELDVKSRRFDNGLQFFFNAVAMRTKQKSQGDWSPDQEVPEFILGGGVSYRIGAFDFDVFTKHVSGYENERFLPGKSAPAPLGDFTELNAKVTYRFGEDKEHSAFVGVDNIGDKKYSTVAGWPDEGRTFWGGLRLRF